MSEKNETDFLAEIADCNTERCPTAPDLVGRYQECARRIWALFEFDPLPDDDPAHFWIDRLEVILDRELLMPKSARRLEDQLVETVIARRKLEIQPTPLSQIDGGRYEAALIMEHVAVDALIAVRKAQK